MIRYNYNDIICSKYNINSKAMQDIYVEIMLHFFSFSS